MAKQSTLRSWRRQKRFAMELRLPQSAQLRWEAMCRRSTLGEDRWTKLATILLRQELGAQPQWAAWHSLAISKLQGTNCRATLEKTTHDGMSKDCVPINVPRTRFSRFEDENERCKAQCSTALDQPYDASTVSNRCASMLA